jgi:endonuclease YncB( thermonuclease family)
MLIFLAASIVTAGQTFTCTPTHVWDGDGPIWCAEGPHVRLSGVAAREMDGTCRRGHPCPEASPTQARDALVRLLGGARGSNSTGHVVVAGPKLTCRSEGSAGGNRTAAWCRLPTGADLSCAMIRTGTVLRWDRYWKGPACR